MQRNSRKRKRKKSRKLGLFILLLAVCAIIYFAVIIGDNNKKQENSQTPLISENSKTKQVEKKESVKIYKGKERPIAVMIDNVEGAFPQAGINDAYMVYEIIVEGGQTRLMALFKGANLELIGPVRSSRHYFLDYAMENDAIYTHYGWSPKAKADISSFGINNINGITAASGIFWRTNEKNPPHNAVINTENILKTAKRYGYRTKSEAKSVLNYVTKEVNLEEGQKAEKVVIPYSTYYNVTYKYDEKSGRYKRITKNAVQTDWKTGKEVTTKNIIIAFASNSTINDGSSKGRQNLDNIGKLKGYYITNGKAIKITCEKKSRKEKTIYKDLQGNVIEVNDGNTFIQICPLNANVSIK